MNLASVSCLTYHICVSNVATYAITQTADVISDVPASKINTNFYKERKQKTFDGNQSKLQGNPNRILGVAPQWTIPSRGK